MQRSGHQHSSVNHSLNFVEPFTGVHTQIIESHWNVKKAYNKKCEAVTEICFIGTYKNICGEIASQETITVLIKSAYISFFYSFKI